MKFSFMMVSWAVFSVAGSLLASESESPPFQVASGFRAELVYRVPRETQGSWVAITRDPQGRLITSDQKGGLYRVTLGTGDGVAVERIEVAIGRAHGLLCAFDSLYVVVAEDEFQGPGLYRVRDSDGDDQYDQVEFLQSFSGRGEHGPHSVVASPDGRSLYVIAGNRTATPTGGSLVPRHWGEDDLLPRIWGPIGSEAGTPAPGGWIAKTDPDGVHWELQAVGLRNGFDLAFNGNGELFTVDADAEFDMGTPWYQPTRLFHVVAGTDFGWRSGSGKWPPYYDDTLPPVVELGAGSPTGVAFGYDTQFPLRYRNALFVADWSQGRILAIHLAPDGATYRGEVEQIVSGKPLPVTDLIGNSDDGGLYFTLGGRGTTSGLYRLLYDGNSEDPPAPLAGTDVREQRRQLESIYRAADAAELDRVWRGLVHSDRFVRHAARLVLERTPVELWRERALTEENPRARLAALLGLARSADSAFLPAVVAAAVSLEPDELDRAGQLAQLRCLEVAFIRGGQAGFSDAQRSKVRIQLESMFPADDLHLDGELCKLLVYLQSAEVTPLAIQRLRESLTQQERFRFALPLRHQNLGWTPQLRQEFFGLLGRASAWRGGLSLQKYVERIGEDSLLHVPRGEVEALRGMLQRPAEELLVSEEQRPVIREWSLAELRPVAAENLGGRDLRSGRRLFAAAKCFACHRFREEGGGVGPDLTTVAKRLSPADLLEAIVEPSKVVSDQFAASTIITLDGRVVTGRVVNLMGDTLLVQTDMLDAAKLERIPRAEIDEMGSSQVSMMPTGLLNTLTLAEIRDLLGFFLTDTAE